MEPGARAREARESAGETRSRPPPPRKLLRPAARGGGLEERAPGDDRKREAATATATTATTAAAAAAAAAATVQIQIPPLRVLVWFPGWTSPPPLSSWCSTRTWICTRGCTKLTCSDSATRAQRRINSSGCATGIEGGCTKSPLGRRTASVYPTSRTSCPRSGSVRSSRRRRWCRCSDRGSMLQHIRLRGCGVVVETNRTTTS
mmetsp:Transcript_10432/g.25610  ORF Transcript_10432/g.25610 Transcript_10432/m.25610 type:complete len:203 (+) Transcript_10432:1552-2160(+)